MVQVREAAGIEVLAPAPDESKHGAVFEKPRRQTLLHFICDTGVEHHIAANLSRVASGVHEGTIRYLGSNTDWHEEPSEGC